MKKLIVVFLFSIVSLFALEQGSLHITKVSYYNDTSKVYSIDDIITNSESLFNEPLEANSIRFPKDAQIWIKVKQENFTNVEYKSVLKFLDIRLDKMVIYNEKGKLLKELGDRVPFANRFYKDPQIAINLATQANNSTCIYIKFTNEDKSDLTYKVYEKEEYLADTISKKIIKSFFFGALVIMLFYNFIFYLFIREKTFLVYILYHIALLVVMLYYNGVVSQYLYPNSYDINGGNVPVFLIYLSVILAVEFLRNFLSLKKYTPKLDRILLIFIVLNFLLMVVHPLKITPTHLPTLVMIPMSLSLLIVSAYHAFILKRKIAFFFLVGWLVMLLAIILTAMLSFGLIERNDLTSHIFQVGIVIEITLLSMGLAYRYKINQDELVKKTRFIHEQSKLASMGEMLGHISHQWRQPLSEINSVAMKIEVDYKKEQLNAELLDKHIEKIEDITEHMSETIDNFNGYFKSNKKCIKVELSASIDKTLNLVQESFAKACIEVEINIDSTESIYIIESELIQVLLVLLNNAREAFSSSHKGLKIVTISVHKHGVKHSICVEDNAGGVHLQDISKVFEPYYTSKFESNGVGIGLYMAKMIVEESLGGKLSVENTQEGALFRIEI